MFRPTRQAYLVTLEFGTDQKMSGKANITCSSNCEDSASCAPGLVIGITIKIKIEVRNASLERNTLSNASSESKSVIGNTAAINDGALATGRPMGAPIPMGLVTQPPRNPCRRLRLAAIAAKSICVHCCICDVNVRQCFSLVPTSTQPSRRAVRVATTPHSSCRRPG